MKISWLAIFFPFWFQVKREELLQFAQNAITGLKINVHLARLSSRSSYFLFYLVSSCFILLSLFSAFWFGLPATAFLQLLLMFHVYICGGWWNLHLEQNFFNWVWTSLNLVDNFPSRCIKYINWLFWHGYKVSIRYLQNHKYCIMLVTPPLLILHAYWWRNNLVSRRVNLSFPCILIHSPQAWQWDLYVGSPKF